MASIAIGSDNAAFELKVEKMEEIDRRYHDARET